MIPNKVTQLNVKETFEIKGRGPVWVIVAKDNGIEGEPEDWVKLGVELGAYVCRPKEIDNYIYKIIGTERLYIGQNSSIGILVKQQ